MDSPIDPVKLQDDLQQEAKDALKDLGLLNILSKFGTPEIIGSMALQVLTRRDIDIEIVTGNPNREDSAKVVFELVKSAKNRIDFDVTDNTTKENPVTPRGFYIGMKYFGNLGYPERKAAHPDVWTIDMWFVKNENAIGRAKTREMKDRLTEEKRRYILEIKNALKDNPKYHQQFGGVDIYDAVINKNVTNLEQFGEYLKESGREL